MQIFVLGNTYAMREVSKFLDTALYFIVLSSLYFLVVLLQHQMDSLHYIASVGSSDYLCTFPHKHIKMQAGFNKLLLQHTGY